MSAARARRHTLLGVRGGVRHHLVHEPRDGRRVVADDSREVGRQAAQVVVTDEPDEIEGGAGLQGLGLAGADRLGDVLVAGATQAVHGAEVVDDRPGGHTGQVSDSASAEVSDPLSRDQLDGGVTDACPCRPVIL